MAVPKWKKRLLWTMASPAMVCLLAWCAVGVGDRQMRAQIAAEERRLGALGVFTRRYNPSEDATDEWKLVVDEIRVRLGRPMDKDPRKARADLTRDWTEPGYRSSFGAIERALAKPWCKRADPFQMEVTRGVLARWFKDNTLALVEKGDVAAANELADLHAAYGRQVERTPSFDPRLQYMLSWRMDSLPDEVRQATFSRSKRSMAWTRQRLERLDTRAKSMAIVERSVNAFRDAVEHRPRKGPKLFTLDWLKDTVTRGPYDKLAVELEGVRAWRVAAEAIASEPSRQRAGCMRLGREVGNALRKGNTRPSRTAALVQTTIADFWGSPELERRLSLISLDLQEQQARGRPIKPTWSKPYCFDPETGKAIYIRYNAGRVALSCAGWSTIMEMQRLRP